MFQEKKNTKNYDTFNIVFSIDRYNNVDNLYDFKNQYENYSSIISLDKGGNINLKTNIIFKEGEEGAEIYNYEGIQEVNKYIFNKDNKNIYINNNFYLDTISFKYKTNNYCNILDLSSLEYNNIIGVDNNSKLYQTRTAGYPKFQKQLNIIEDFKCNKNSPPSSQIGGGILKRTNKKSLDKNFINLINKNKLFLLSDLEGLNMESYILDLIIFDNEPEKRLDPSSKAENKGKQPAAAPPVAAAAVVEVATDEEAAPPSTTTTTAAATDEETAKKAAVADAKAKRAEEERIEQERIEQERIEQERIEQERIEQERIEKERIEQERLAVEKKKADEAKEKLNRLEKEASKAKYEQKKTELEAQKMRKFIAHSISKKIFESNKN